MIRRAAALTAVLVLALTAPAHAGDRVHRGDTRTQVNHHLADHGEPLGGYRDHGVRHRVRRYPTARAHVWTVVDYRVRPHHLRVWFVTSCTWTPDGVDCTPGSAVVSEQLSAEERAEEITRALADDLCAKAHPDRFDPDAGVFHCQECYALACEVMDAPTFTRLTARLASRDARLAAVVDWSALGLAVHSCAWRTLDHDSPECPCDMDTAHALSEWLRAALHHDPSEAGA